MQVAPAFCAALSFPRFVEYTDPRNGWVSRVQICGYCLSKTWDRSMNRSYDPELRDWKDTDFYKDWHYRLFDKIIRNMLKHNRLSADADIPDQTNFKLLHRIAPQNSDDSDLL